MRKGAKLLMDVATISQLISSIGFPIAVSLVCFWYINKQEERNKSDIEKLATAINNNTAVMQKILDEIDRN